MNFYSKCIYIYTHIQIAIEINKTKPTFINGLPFRSDPFTSRQHLLHHTFSPLISIEATHNVDLIFQSIINNNDNISTLQIFKPYGNNAKYSINTNNQQFKIINNQLITRIT